MHETKIFSRLNLSLICSYATQKAVKRSDQMHLSFLSSFYYQVHIYVAQQSKVVLSKNSC